MKNMIRYYESQIEVHEGIIEFYKDSSNPEHVMLVNASRLAIKKYNVKIAAIRKEAKQ